ncbi:hypothetical protein FQN55_003734 [Onygenales sp. PD_40]|nr:hypothetical protein FQN55_003734 [Onygenales sp. PD_40]KAK2766510.1 hypothetical protein FQN53_006727 [Emmonsiellopsis sp. PD_33]KAK2793964.1 hypothetical protein FQN52_000296 [Onygenales sp. PD_12]KAK2800634.1 hypothetical protein FQN51_006017 [Onygenales sp. PD_10]
MATWAYPQLAPDRLKQEEEDSLARELQWLLSSLQESLASLREGLQGCAALLAPTEPGSTLVLSSLRSENVKGFVTRVGTQIVKGDIHLRLHSLPPPKGANSTRLTISNLPTATELALPQLGFVRRLINESLDVVDVSTWTGDPKNPNFISGQLRLLHDNLLGARLTLKGDNEESKKPWYEGSADENSFDPPLPPYLSFHLSVSEAALVLSLRTLEPVSPESTPTTSFAPEISLSGFSLRDRIFGPRHPVHDESGDVFNWNGEEVRVKEKTRVESQDPSLMSAMAKLTALEHEVARWRSALASVMGEEDTDSE